MRKLLAKLAALMALGCALSSVGWGHGGGLDSLGCHHNRKAGSYHCHRGPLAGRYFNSKAEAQQALSASEADSTKDEEKKTATPGQGNADTKVWVNTNSGVYHCPGSKWYGTTKQGKYMPQKQAQEAGHRPAYGSPCQ